MPYGTGQKIFRPDWYAGKENSYSGMPAGFPMKPIATERGRGSAVTTKAGSKRAELFLMLLKL